MKKTFSLSLFLLFLLLTAFTPSEKLIAKWEITSIQEKDKTKIKKPGRWLEFKADGTLVGGQLNENDLYGEVPVLTGSWKIDGESKQLTMYYAKDDIRIPEVFKVVKCTSKKLILKSDQVKLHLAKMDKI